MADMALLRVCFGRGLVVARHVPVPWPSGESGCVCRAGRAVIGGGTAEPSGNNIDARGIRTTNLQEAAYNAQLAAGLPVSELARMVLIKQDGIIAYKHCASYLHAIQQTAWFTSAFPAHAVPVTVRGGKGVSHADAVQRRIKIGTYSRFSVGECEQACLHELAHIVTSDYGPGEERREPALGTGSSKGHHHAWRVNFILVVRKTLGNQPAMRLRHEFGHWGLPTSR